MYPKIVEPNFSCGDRVKLRYNVFIVQKVSKTVAIIEKGTEGVVIDVYIDPHFASQNKVISSVSFNSKELFCYEVQLDCEIPHSTNMYVISYTLLKRVKEKTKKEKKLPLNALHPDIRGSGYLNPLDEMPQPSGINILKKNDDSPRIWSGSVPDLTSSNNYQEALKLPFGEKREKALKKALSKSKKQALKEGAEIH